MQDRTPLVAETGLQGLPRYFGDYAYKLLIALRRFPKGRTLKDLSGDIGAMPQDVQEVEDALAHLVDLGVVERDTMNNETVWRVSYGA